MSIRGSCRGAVSDFCVGRNPQYQFLFCLVTWRIFGPFACDAERGRRVRFDRWTCIRRLNLPFRVLQATVVIDKRRGGGGSEAKGAALSRAMRSGEAVAERKFGAGGNPVGHAAAGAGMSAKKLEEDMDTFKRESGQARGDAGVAGDGRACWRWRLRRRCWLVCDWNSALARSSAFCDPSACLTPSRQLLPSAHHRFVSRLELPCRRAPSTFSGRPSVLLVMCLPSRRLHR